jgi:hypothetical protein
MAKSRRSQRKSRKSRGRSRRMRGGQAPVNYSNPGPMALNLAQGEQFLKFHEKQHGGALNTSGAYPGVVEQASVLPSSLVASAKLTGLNESFRYISQFGPSSDNPNLIGGRRRRGSRKSRKSRKGRKQRGGVLVRWGGGRKGSRKSRKGSRKSRKGRKGSRKGRSRRMRGGSYAEMRFPMSVADESKMLLPSGLASQAAGSMNPEWELAKNPMSFAPKM